MNKRTQTVLEIIGMGLAVVIACGIVYGSWQLVRHVHYSLSYEDMVKQTVCEMVKTEHLKNPSDCKQVIYMKKVLASNVHVSELYVGRVVEDKPLFSEYTDIGHIVGFGYSSYNELLVLVKYSKRSEPSLVHPANINIFVNDT